MELILEESRVSKTQELFLKGLLWASARGEGEVPIGDTSLWQVWRCEDYKDYRMVTMVTALVSSTVHQLAPTCATTSLYGNSVEMYAPMR